MGMRRVYAARAVVAGERRWVVFDDVDGMAWGRAREPLHRVLDRYWLARGDRGPFEAFTGVYPAGELLAIIIDLRPGEDGPTEGRATCSTC